MSVSAIDCFLPLFVPASRPERIAKAAAAGTDAVIIDLEDAVAPAAKEAARRELSRVLRDLPKGPARLLLRINAEATRWHADDLTAAANLPIDGIVLPKAETRRGVEAVKASAAGQLPLIALIESALGLHAVHDVAAAADRLAFGSVDFAADLGCAHGREALLGARSQIVLASRVAGLPQPLDGVTLAVGDDAEVEVDARYAASLGFGGKLLIHPAQIMPARRGLAPSASEVEWARRIVDSVGDGAAVAVDGMMIDAPVLARARIVLTRHEAISGGRAQHGQ